MGIKKDKQTEEPSLEDPRDEAEIRKGYQGPRFNPETHVNESSPEDENLKDE